MRPNAVYQIHFRGSHAPAWIFSNSPSWHLLTPI
jgi:hypothetical protein